ncbi:MAG TPA: alanine racemase C-terminal domain-containing protein [Pontimonas sp.]|nr:alanine racemase C-terminal domain-containing protein [Pontimonas sp.]
MNAPASLSAPLRRVRFSHEALAHAFAELSGQGLIPDLRSNAYGLGLERVSAIARDAGLTEAVISEADRASSVLPAAAPATSGSITWLEGSHVVVTLEADVVSLKRVPAGTPVSYGYQYRTPRETTLALISAGFADGVPRTASMKGHVALAGATHLIAGRIAMDQMVVDIGDTSASLGDVATIWGSTPTLLEWSQWSGRPSSLLVAQLAPRVVTIWE